MAKKFKILFASVLSIVAIRAFIYHAFVNPFDEFRLGPLNFGLGVFLYTGFYLWVNFSKNQAAVNFRINRHREITARDEEVDQLHIGKMEAIFLAALIIFLGMVFTSNHLSQPL